MHVAALITANNDPRAQKSNPGDNTLDDATRIGADMTKRGNRYGRTQSNQSECAHPHRLAAKIAVKSEEHADRRRR